MYVLHHADKPSLYHGLPDHPRISPLVRVEGPRQAARARGIAVAALAGFFHYTRIGPNETHAEDEQAAVDEARRIRESRANLPRSATMNDSEPRLIRVANERSNHWITAITFVLLALSGLALFHPAMFWLSALFGGGQWTRILHPFVGVVMFVSFMILVLRFWHHNVSTKPTFNGSNRWTTCSTTARTSCRKSANTTPDRSCYSSRWWFACCCCS
jgi:heme A synthase